MSRLSVLGLALSLFAVGCSSDSTPTTPTAPATRFVFTSTLSSANENPPVSNAEAGARGEATITMNVTRDASNNITAATVDVSATFSSFPAGTIISAAHIHTGATGANGGVLVPMVPSAGEVTMPNGSGSFVKGGFPVTPVDVANQIIANPAGFYFNVHTALNPGGAARGQLALRP